MDFLYAVINNFNYALGIAVGSILSANFNRKRNHFVLRVIGVALIAVVMAVIGAAIRVTFGKNTITDAITYSLSTLAAFSVIPFCFNLDLLRSLYSVINGNVVRCSFSRIVLILCALFGIVHDSFFALPIDYAVMALFYCAVYFAFTRKIIHDDNFIPNKGQTIFLFISMLVIMNMGSLESVLGAVGTGPFILFCFSECAFGILVIGLQFLHYFSEKQKLEMLLEKHIADERLAHAENFRNIIDAMNIKVHDLKHQLHKITSNQAVSEEVLRQLNEVAAEYEMYIDTGNDIINTILTEKHFLCLSNQIRLTIMLDGKAFSFMSAADINALFGNALDNAIEYLQTVSEEKRFIRVSCREEGEGMLTLRVENYFEGELKIDAHGMPITHKKDTFYHGFSTKSIKQIAEKYGGGCTFKVEDGMFKLTVFFPLFNKEKGNEKPTE